MPQLRPKAAKEIKTNKMWYINTMKYYLTLKGGHSDTWMNLEGIILGGNEVQEEDTQDSTYLRYIE